MKIYYLSLDRLLPGMIVADDVFLDDGTILLKNKSFLSLKDITRLKLYSVETIPVVIPAQVAECIDKASISHWNKVRSTQEFKFFLKKYNETGNKISTVFQNLVVSSATEAELYEIVEDIYSMISDSYSITHIFDLLHCIRDYDDSTFLHSLNVALISHCIGTWMNLDEVTLRRLTYAGLVHDVGKMLVPYELITKPTKLTDDEYEIVKRHPLYGNTLMTSFYPDSLILDAVLLHHERMDGSGYPYGCTGDGITLFARIVAIADVYDAMTALRTYRDRISPFDVVAAFEHDGYSKYDPAILLPFLTRIAQSCIGVPVLLSNALVGEVIMINPQNLSRPIVKIGTEFLDLNKEPEITIRALC